MWAAFCQYVAFWFIILARHYCTEWTDKSFEEYSHHDWVSHFVSSIQTWYSQQDTLPDWDNRPMTSQTIFKSCFRFPRSSEFPLANLCWHPAHHCTLYNILERVRYLRYFSLQYTEQCTRRVIHFVAVQIATWSVTHTLRRKCVCVFLRGTVCAGRC